MGLYFSEARQRGDCFIEVALGLLSYKGAPANGFPCQGNLSDRYLASPK